MQDVDVPILYGATGNKPEMKPSEIGVSGDSSPAFLKGLDLGGGDQRKIESLLEKGDKNGAEELLVANKKGEANRSYILTGGPLDGRQKRCMLLAETFPSMRFVTIHPEVEGRMTLRAGSAELGRLVASSGGDLTHVLLVAKGSTDLHMAWLDSSGVASAEGCATSAVHKPKKTDPSSAKEIFDEFVARPANASLAAACQQGACALIFAGASVHALGGKSVAAAGNYFRLLTTKELEAADPKGASLSATTCR